MEQERDASFIEEPRERGLSLEYGSNSDSLMEELIDDVEGRIERGEEEKDLHQYLSSLQKQYFSFHPSLFSYCSAERALPLASRANRYEQIRGWFGQTMVGDLVYRLSGATEGGARRLLGSIETMSLGDKLDAINFLQTVGADAIAQGSWALPALEHIRQAIKRLVGSDSTPYVRYAAELTAGRLETESQDPSLGVLTYYGPRGEAAGRLPAVMADELQRDDKFLSARLLFDPPVGVRHRLFMGSSNVVVELDRTNQPVRYGYIPEMMIGEDGESEEICDQRLLTNFYELAADKNLFQPRNIYSTIDAIRRYLWRSPAQWQRQTNLFTERQWADVLSSFDNFVALDEMLGGLQSELDQEAAERKLAVSNEVIERIYQEVKGRGSLIDYIEPELSERLIAAWEAGDKDQAFWVIEKITTNWKYFGSVPGAAEALLRRWEDLLEHRQRISREVSTELERRAEQIIDQHQSAVEDFQNNTDVLVENTDVVRRSLVRYLDEQWAKLQSRLPTVSLHDYWDIKDDIQAIPMRGEDDHQLSGLLAQLHRPEMVALINQDLQTDIRDMPLNAQIQLLSLLSRDDGALFAKIREVMQSEVGFKQNFLLSFLASARDPQFGERVIDLARNLQPEVADDVFAAYAAFVEKVNLTRDYLATHCSDQLASHPELEETVMQGLLRSGKQVLERAGQEKDPTQIKQELEAADSDLSMMANTFKAIIKAGEQIDLQQLPGVELSVVAGGQLEPAVKNQILAIARQNWLARPHMYQAVIGGLEAALDNPNSKFYLVEQNGKVVGFFRLDQTETDELYFGSVNIRPEARGYALTQVLLQQVLAKEIAGRKVVAHCDPWDQVTEQYVATGFFASKLMDYSGQPAFQIEHGPLPPNSDLVGMDYQELYRRLSAGDRRIEQYVFTKDPVRSPNESENERFMADIRRRVNDGTEVVANYRFGPRNQKGSLPVLVVFAPDPKLAQTEPDASWLSRSPQ